MKSWLLFIVSLCLMADGLLAQTRPITGQVSTPDNQPVPGATVVVKDSRLGTTTDAEGRFSLNLPAGATTLRVSSIGFLATDVPIGERSTIAITLASDDKSLNEVVVVGYGLQEKKDLTTSIAKVLGKDIGQLPVSTPGEALAGLAAGVQVQAGAGGYPGEAPAIRIRGFGSLGASNNPLYVVDGYPLPDPAQFNRINTSDIESIEVLKDAASAAIYGSRAANGVVIVTTKRGKAGQTRFELSAYTGIQQVAKRVATMNKEQYLAYALEAARIRNVAFPAILNTPDQLADTDWQDVIFRNAPISEYQLTASGGNEKTRFSISGAYLSQTGTLRGTDYQLATLRANLDIDLSRKLKLGVNFAPSFSRQNRRPAGGTFNSANESGEYGRAVPNPVYAALLMAPVLPVRAVNGDYFQPNQDPAYSTGNWFGLNYNPLAVLELVKNQNDQFRLFNNGFLEYEVVPGLKLKTQGGLSLEMLTQDVYVPSTLSTDATPLANLSNPQLTGVYSAITNARRIDYIWENTATYDRRFEAGHHLNGLLLYSLQRFDALATSAAGRNGTYVNDIVQNPTASSDVAGGVSFGRNAFISYAGRVNYDFRDRYYLSAAVRRDGSSRFGPANRFGVFPSFSAGWRIGEEAFMKGQKLVSELKLRGSYGETGNAGIGDFTWQNGIGSANYSFNNTRQVGTFQTGFANPDLTWERNKQVDIGLETAFWQDRIYLTVDLYRKVTSGLLFARGLPALVGYANSFQTNVGEMENRGLEIALTTRNIESALRWTTDVNMSFNRNHVIALDGRQQLDASEGVAGWANVYRIRVGEPIGDIFGYRLLGVYKNQADLDGSAKWAAGSQIGDIKAEDTNNDGKIDESDMVRLGSGLPLFTFGMTNRFTFKQFDASFIVQGTYGNSIINGNLRHSQSTSGRFNGTPDMLNNYFLASTPDRDVRYARPNTGGFITANFPTSYAVFDGSFLRVRNITFGYTLPTNLAGKLKLQSARLYLTGQNLFTLTNYIGFNPEPALSGNSPFQPGNDQGTYPANRSLVVGLNVGF